MYLSNRDWNLILRVVHCIKLSIGKLIEGLILNLALYQKCQVMGSTSIKEWIFLNIMLSLQNYLYSTQTPVLIASVCDLCSQSLTVIYMYMFVAT